MEIAGTLIQALIGAAVAVLIWEAIDGSWAIRPMVAKWLALALIAWIGLAGPFVLG